MSRHPSIRRSVVPRAGLAAALLLVLSGALRAGEFTVNTAADLPDVSPSNPDCDADLNSPGLQITLRAAIMQANANDGPDTITVPDGLWKLTLKGAAEDGAATGDLDVTEDLTIIGTAADPDSGADGTILDGKKLKDRLFEVSPGVTLTLQNLTLRNGKTAKDESGGAAHVFGALVMDHVIVRNCKASADGGAIDLTGSAGGLTLTDVFFFKNSAGADGGAIDADGGFTQATRVTFQKNHAGGKGGALSVAAALASLTNVTLSANSAKTDGGAVSLESGSVLTLVGVTSCDNSCKKTSGFAFQLGTTIVSRNAIFDDKGKRNASSGISSLGGNVDSGATCKLPQDEVSDADPKLLKLANYGGFTPTCALDDQSPAIDAGTSNGAPDTDQRGMGRVDVDGAGDPSGVYDTGAFEFVPKP